MPGKEFAAMASSDGAPHSAIQSAPSPAPASENFRSKSIATRLTETEFSEVETAANSAGKKVAEWLREAALTQARTEEKAPTDPVLLAEILALRDLVLNLFAVASKGPLSDETLRKISAYADSIKGQKTEELLARIRAQSSAKVQGKP
jgi:hypothetical protein